MKEKISDSKFREEKDTLFYPLLDDLLKNVPSKYEMVLLASLRAKQIIRKARRGPTLEGELSEEAFLEAKGTKPLSQALYEIAGGKLEREKLFLLEYLESFRAGEERIPLPAATEVKKEFVFEEPEDIKIEELGVSEELVGEELTGEEE